MYKKAITGWLSFVVTTFMVAAGLCSAESNLVVNAGFEEGREGNPRGWTRPDNLSVFWEPGTGTSSGKCLRFDTDVYRNQWEEHQENPDAPVTKMQPTGKKYNTLAGTEGVKAWSSPVSVTPGQHYVMQVDVKGPGGAPFVYLKGYRRCSEAEAERHGKMRFFQPHAEGNAYSVVIGGDTKRPPREGDYIQVFRKRLVCRLPGDNKWRRFRQPVQIRTGRFACDRILLMLYASWPPGNYYFDNVRFAPIRAEAARALRESRTKHGRPVE